MLEDIPMELTVDTKEFEKAMDGFIAANANEIARESALAVAVSLLQRIVFKNPVDTGRSRAGWGAAGDLLGVPVPEGRISGDPPARIGRPALKPGDIKKGSATISPQGARVLITLTNGVEYTVDLENGTSTQAPFGMVRISIRELVEELGGSRAIPNHIREIYREAWSKLGLDEGTQFRAGQLRDVLELTRGMNVGA